MLTENFFHCIFWVSTVSVIWFYTDWVIHYAQLFNLAETFRLQYSTFITKNKNQYFPDFLYSLSLKTSNRFIKFIYKLVSCPFCLIFWLACIACLTCLNFVAIAPLYIISLFIVLQIKKLI